MHSQTLVLLRRFHSGDSDALGELVQRHLEWVRTQVHNRLGKQLRAKFETQDIVQDVMIDVLRDGPRLLIDDDDAFRRLLARIVENTICDRYRYLQRDQRDVGRERGVAPDTILDLDPPVQGVTRPSQHADKHEREGWVRLALEFLDPSDREVIWLREWEGLTFGEIGKRAGISEDGARKRFDRALPVLAQRVAELRDGRVRRLLEAQGRGQTPPPEGQTPPPERGP